MLLLDDGRYEAVAVEGDLAELLIGDEKRDRGGGVGHGTQPTVARPPVGPVFGRPQR